MNETIQLGNGNVASFISALICIKSNFLLDWCKRNLIFHFPGKAQVITLSETVLRIEIVII